MRSPLYTYWNVFEILFFSYVDANGALITVKYTAGVDGYLETRNEQPGFVSIRAQPASSFAAPARPVAVPAPAPAAPNDSDLVAKIISQLTPFIQQTVSSSLSSSTQAVRQPAVVPRPAPVAPASSTIDGVFGFSGQNNVRVETPNFNFNYDLQK